MLQLAGSFCCAAPCPSLTSPALGGLDPATEVLKPAVGWALAACSWMGCRRQEPICFVRHAPSILVPMLILHPLLEPVPGARAPQTPSFRLHNLLIRHVMH